MTSLSRILPLATAGVFVLALSACSGTSAPQLTAEATLPTGTSSIVTPDACAGNDGVTITVDSSALDGGAAESWCYTSSKTVAVADALVSANITTEGTKQYGDQVVCRVDGQPSATAPVGSTEDPAYVESCETMPAAFAYWSLWVKPSGGEWSYAIEGLSTLTAEPGDSVELLFTLDGAPASPSA